MGNELKKDLKVMHNPTKPLIIKLNSNLKEGEPWRKCTQKNIIDDLIEDTVQKKVGHQLTLIKGLLDTDEVDSHQKGYLYYLADCYSLHKKVTLSPSDIWYTILTEITSIIHTNSDKCQDLFTTSDKKIDISIHQEKAAEINPQKLLEKLKDYIPTNVDLFLPIFSTDTEAYKVASAAAFAGGLTMYYNYFTYLCGIPEIKIVGTIMDWTTIKNNLSTICTIFDEKGIKAHENKSLSKWSSDISHIIDMICNGLKGEDITEFMKDMVRIKNIGSGSEMIINGWISNIYCSECDLKKLENFSLCLGILPYKELSSGIEYVAVHGLFSTKRDYEGFTYPIYDYFIFEKGKAINSGF